MRILIGELPKIRRQVAIHPSLPLFVALLTQIGREYYYNRITKETTWNKVSFSLFLSL
jgi:hypothetical protein